MNNPGKSKPAKKRIQQRTKPLMNELEARFSAWLRSKSGDFSVYEQAITFRLANGCKYTPDVVVTFPDGNEMECYEVKGKHAWDDAIVKLKVAATQFHHIRWCLVSVADCQWNFQDVLP